METTEEGKPAIRFALAAVKRVGAAAMEALVAARDASAPFASVADFAHRVDPKLLNKMQIENLAKAGAFDRLENEPRPPRCRRRGRSCAAPRPPPRTVPARQIGLFGGADSKPEPLRLPDMPDWPQLEKLAFEAEAVGFHLSAHPLDTYKAVLKRLGVTPSTGHRRARQVRPGAPEAGRHGGGDQGTADPHRQPDGLGDALGRRPAASR